MSHILIIRRKASADKNLKSLAGLVSELWPSVELVESSSAFLWRTWKKGRR